MPRRPKRSEDFHSIDVHVGKMLRIRREQRGISRRRLGQAAGVVHHQVEKYEAAINRVSPGCLYRFARFLDVPVVYFFEDLVPPTAQVPPPHASMALSDNVFSSGKLGISSKPTTRSATPPAAVRSSN